MLFNQEGKIMHIDPQEDFYDRLVNVLLAEMDSAEHDE